MGHGPILQPAPAWLSEVDIDADDPNAVKNSDWNEVRGRRVMHQLSDD